MTAKKTLPLLLLALLVGCGIQGGSAPHVEIGERPYRKLTWDDFKLIDRSDNGMSAQTTTFIQWSFDWTVSRSGGGHVARLTDIKIDSGMDPEQSWRVRSVPQGSLDLLLAHEQLHYDINEIHAAKLRAMGLDEWGTGYGSTSDLASKDLTAKIEAIAKSALDEVQRLSDEYDRETAHGTNVDAQRRWAREIDSQISQG